MHHRGPKKKFTFAFTTFTILRSILGLSAKVSPCLLMKTFTHEILLLFRIERKFWSRITCPEGRGRDFTVLGGVLDEADACRRVTAQRIYLVILHLIWGRRYHTSTICFVYRRILNITAGHKHVKIFGCTCKFYGWLKGIPVVN